MKTARAYNWALRFEQVYELNTQEAGPYLRRWIVGAVRSRLQPIIDFAHMVDDHWPGVLRWFERRISNGLLEGLNSLVQSAKRRARAATARPALHRDDPSHRREARHGATHVK